MRKGTLLATVLTCFAQAGSALAEDAGPPAASAAEPVDARAAARFQDDEASLAQKLAKVSAAAHDEAVRAPAKQAELALARARGSKDSAAKARQLGIARAALALAEARVELLRERELSSSATRRRLEAARRAEQARTLLKQAERPCPSCSQASAAPSGGQP